MDWSRPVMYETFEHTADLGLRIKAPDLPTLFVEAGRALTSVLLDNPEDIRAEREIAIRIEGSDREYLLFDWLNELLYRFETERLLFAEFNVALDKSGLSAACRGEPADPQRHRLAHEVKAITYHQLQVRQTADGWEAQVIVDI